MTRICHNPDSDAQHRAERPMSSERSESQEIGGKRALTLEPDIGVPYEPALKYVDLVERAKAACNTAQTLEQYGAEFPIEEEDRMIAATLATAYASNPEHASKSVSNSTASTFRPASMVLTAKILTEFSHDIVAKSIHIRRLVTNKLILETESSDPRIRLKAMELLGKISDVGLFTEKTEITVTHQSTDDLRSRLKNKLHRLILPDEEITDVVVDQ